ncbi:N/A [soil metagenome]
MTSQSVSSAFAGRRGKTLLDLILGGPGIVLLAALVATPLLLVIWQAVAPADGEWFVNLKETVSKELYRGLLWKSLTMATGVTLISCAIAWPAGWAISRAAPSSQPRLLMLVLVPYLMSYLLLIYAVLVILTGDGPFMRMVAVVPGIESTDSILYTSWATMIVLIYEHLPIMIVVLYSASGRISDDLLQAARSMGAGPVDRFRRIVFPLTAPTFFAAFALVFIPVAGSFAEAQILGGPNGLLYGNVLADQVTRVSNPGLAAALSLMLISAILIILAILTIIRHLLRRSPRLVRDATAIA